MIRGSRIAKLEGVLLPKPPRILGVTLDMRSGQLRCVLFHGRGNQPAPPGLTVADLPPDCLIYKYSAAEEIPTLYEVDGRARVQRIIGVDEDEVFGRDFQPTAGGKDQ